MAAVNVARTKDTLGSEVDFGARGSLEPLFCDPLPIRGRINLVHPGHGWAWPEYKVQN